MAPPVRVSIQQLPHAAGLPLPAYQTAGAAGLDLLAAVGEPVVLAPGERRAIPSGLRVALPPGTEGQIRPRSGLALERGLTMVNTPGTIDSDYRGEIKLSMINLGTDPVVIERGMRIAQLVVAPVLRVAWDLERELQDTARGAGGFGSTGEGDRVGTQEEATGEAGGGFDGAV